MRGSVHILAWVVAAAVASGCTSTVDPATRLTTVTDAEAGGYSAVAASGLVFDPPVATGEPPIDLARAPRQPSAFFGYDEGSVEYYQLTVDDTQQFGGGRAGYRYGGSSGCGWYGGNGSGWSDRYERRAVSVRVGSIRR